MSLVRAIVLGGVDGVITSFAVVAGANAGNMPTQVILVIGVSSVLADGASMGISEYLSSTAEAAVDASSSHRQRKAVHPAYLGVACFTSFVCCGAIPLVVYFLAQGSLLVCALLALVELMLLGAVRAHSTKESLLLALGQTALLGTAAGGIAYGVGRTVDLFSSS